MTFLSDQGRDAIILKRIITFEHFPAIGAPSSVGQVYLGPFYYYLVAPFLGLFNFDPVGPAVGVALFSIAGIIASYFAVKKEISSAVAIFFLAILTFSATLTEYSRFSWNPNLLPYFNFFTLYFFYTLLEKPTIRKGVIFGALLGFSIQLHYLGSLLIVPITLFLIWTLVNFRSFNKYLKSIVSAFFSFILALSPLIIFDLRHDFLNSRQFYKLFTEGGLSSGSSYPTRIIETVHGLIRHGFQLSTTPLISIVILLTILTVGILVFRKTKSQFILLHVLNILLYIFGFALLGGERLAHYYGPVVMSFYFLCASSIILIKKSYLQIILASSFITCYIVMNIPKMYYLFEKGNNQILEAKNIALSITKYIKKQPIQTVALPSIESDGHYRYFLEIDGYKLLPQDSPDQPEELYVICQKICNPTGDGQWQIAAFTNKFLDTQWNVENVTIFKFIHKKIQI
ncbi:MAG: hypothetical protein US54_C0017G0010 [Candidatus Roizmanbacteria bacterium GW2011_GWA2_37_7]|uniref:Glycosyltransferase RgtA/B/C/D-like domain-containing protein n=1 Tax=Candidatus Roizmanbacteria bacterium GW2011_GWA2_37_7 TaxID=1618481 RepID=A0A0G0JMT6_9BACT|nr:MAG: hypothetical protein US54_C0017G0010 [Candidatus Roizmanbacteria bacterium GW2011_GWA2_37_7]